MATCICTSNSSIEKNKKMASSSSPHIVLFPFMSKGHTIPLLHLARLLLDRHVTVTVFTTPANRPFVAASLPSSVSVLSLPFPDNVQGVPDGVESTDKLPSMSLFAPFAVATRRMQPPFEEALRKLPCVTCVISDGFLGWTGDVATKLGIPRLVFYGMNHYAQALIRDVMSHRLLLGPELDNEPIALTSFPWIKLTRNDFSEPFNAREPSGPLFEFVMEQIISTSKSYGMIVNSFYELESLYMDYWNREAKPKSWCVGPLCLAQPVKTQHEAHKKPMWLEWLDHKHELGRSILYVAFGSQAEISPQQLTEIALGLENSEVNFLWVMKKDAPDLLIGFEERVKERGLVVRDWVDQRVILEHEAVQGFLSHCGWNSVMESICAKVPILTWPMMAEQHLNARMVTEEINIGLWVETVDGNVRGFVNKEGLEKTVKELMEGEIGKVARKKVKEHGESARKALEKGGSSWNALNHLIEEIQAQRQHC